MEDRTTYLKEAIFAAELAKQIQLSYQRSGFEIETKSTEFDLVTTADKEAEKVIAAHLLSKFPSHSILGEEGGAKGNSPYRWIVDPIDGTVNFAHNLPCFSVSIGLEIEGKMEVGVIIDTTRGDVFTAIRGQGAHVNGAPIKVSKIKEIKQSLLATGFSYRLDQRKINLDFLDKTVGQGLAVRRLGSAALDLAYVAMGRFDGFWELSLSPWDAAAGVLLVEEAGGQVSTLEKGPYKLGDYSIVATNSYLHEPLIDLLKGPAPEF